LEAGTVSRRGAETLGKDIRLVFRTVTIGRVLAVVANFVARPSLCALRDSAGDYHWKDTADPPHPESGNL